MIRHLILVGILGLGLVACGDDVGTAPRIALDAGLAGVDAGAIDAESVAVDSQPVGAGVDGGCESFLMPKQSDVPCIWWPPTGLPCGGNLSVVVDGKTLPKSSWRLICGADDIVIDDGDACSAAASSGATLVLCTL